MSNLEGFLTHSQEQEIIETIRHAEQRTSGEIRVHIESDCNTTIYEHALEVFSALKMHNTTHRNGVLIYIAINNKAFVIYGDKGINAVVDENFWNSTRDKMASQFKSQNYKQGIIDGIKEASRVLSKYFPWENTDTNELDDSISKG